MYSIVSKVGYRVSLSNILSHGIPPRYSIPPLVRIPGPVQRKPESKIVDFREIQARTVRSASKNCDQDFISSTAKVF